MSLPPDNEESTLESTLEWTVNPRLQREPQRESQREKDRWWLNLMKGKNQEPSVLPIHQKPGCFPKTASGKIVWLEGVFEDINLKHFDGFLDEPRLRANSRLRSSAGRFIPGSRKYPENYPPTIELAAYLWGESNAEELIWDTMGHEMIHYWLWVRRKPYGHTPEFWAKMKQMGVSRYNTVPKSRPYKYLYVCPGCRGEFPARRVLKALACSKCCNAHANGKYDSRFKLYLDRRLAPEEAPLPAKPSKP